MILRFIYLITISLGLFACATSQPNSQWARHAPQSTNNLDSLEMLLHDDHDTQLAEIAPSEHKGDLRLGMMKNSVESYWGRPDRVEVAGRHDQGVERWTYERQIATTSGSHNEKKVIYFEAGSVVGWETY